VRGPKKVPTSSVNYRAVVGVGEMVGRGTGRFGRREAMPYASAAPEINGSPYDQGPMAAR